MRTWRHIQSLSPSLAISINDLRNVFGRRADEYEVGLLHDVLLHIPQHGMLIYQRDLKHLEECNSSNSKTTWQAVKDLSDHLTRLGILCDLARELLWRISAAIDILTERDVSREPPPASRAAKSTRISMPKILSEKFGATGIVGLDKIDMALDDIFESLLIVYNDLFPRLKNNDQNKPQKEGEIIVELTLHFAHIVGHCDADTDAFCELLSFFEDSLAD